jgi:hypothetical protein
MTINGQGNMATVTKPLVADKNDFKIYEPQIKESPNGKSFEQVMSPMSTSLTQIPQVSFSFFDPEAREYKTLTAGPWPLEVTEAQPVPPAESPAADNQARYPGEEKLGSDIFYIKESGNWINKEKEMLYQKPGFWVLVAFPVPVLWGIMIWAHEKRKFDGDKRYARRLLAPRKAKNGIRLAQQLLKESKNQEFCAALSKLIREYFGDRFHVSGASVTLDTVLGHIDSKLVPGEVIDKITRVFQDCDAARYAPTAFQEELMRKALGDAETIIDFFEKEHRVKGSP